MKGWDGWVAEISATGLKIFPYEHSIPVTGTKRFWQNSFKFATGRPKWHNFAQYVFLLQKYAIFFVSKVTRVDKATIVANDAKLLSQFVFVYRVLSHLGPLHMIPVDQAGPVSEISAHRQIP